MYITERSSEPRRNVPIIVCPELPNDYHLSHDETIIICPMANLQRVIRNASQSDRASHDETYRLSFVRLSFVRNYHSPCLP